VVVLSFCPDSLQNVSLKERRKRYAVVVANDGGGGGGGWSPVGGWS